MKMYVLLRVASQQPLSHHGQDPCLPTPSSAEPRCAHPPKGPPARVSGCRGAALGRGGSVP